MLRTRALKLTLFALGLASLTASLAGCKKDTTSETAAAAAAARKLEVTKFDKSGLITESYDLNGDGIDDQVRYYKKIEADDKGKKTDDKDNNSEDDAAAADSAEATATTNTRKNEELRYVTFDINFDGTVDLTEFYEKGVHVRDEIDLDYDGICDLIVRYKDGHVAKKEFSVDFEGNRHGIQFFNEKGERIEVHRDTNADGKTDIIEYYNSESEEPYKIVKQNAND